MTPRRAPDLSFVLSVVDLLAAAGLRTWLFGGWAEELRGLAPPGRHERVRLLYPGPDFRRVELLLGPDEAGEEWLRRYAIDDVPVELVLVRLDRDGWFTDFPHGRHRWPADVFEQSGRLPVASVEAITGFVRPRARAA